MCAWCVYVEVKGQRHGVTSLLPLMWVPGIRFRWLSYVTSAFSTESSCWPKRISWIQGFKASLDDSIVRAYFKQRNKKGEITLCAKVYSIIAFLILREFFFLDVLLKGHEICYSYCLLCRLPFLVVFINAEQWQVALLEWIWFSLVKTKIPPILKTQ